MGIHTYGANAVYFLAIQSELPRGLVAVRNIVEGAKRNVDCQESTVERDVVFPLLRGRDVGTWRASPGQYILVPHQANGDPIAETQLKVEFPKAYEYVWRFQKVLHERSEFNRRGSKGDWYRLFSIYPETFSKWKVVWREQARLLTLAVVSDHMGKTVIPDHKLMFVPCALEDEAHYICATLSSTVSQSLVKACSIETSISTQILNYIRVPPFDASSSTHMRLSWLSKQAHILAAQGTAGDDQLSGVKDEMDLRAAELWGLSKEELKDIRTSLEEIG